MKPVERGVVLGGKTNHLVLVGVELDPKGSDLFNKWCVHGRVLTIVEATLQAEGRNGFVCKDSWNAALLRFLRTSRRSTHRRKVHPGNKHSSDGVCH